MDAIAASFFIGSSSNLKVTRAAIKSRTSSNSGHICLLTLELRSFERWKKSCGYDSTFIFDWIFVKLADIQDRYKVLDFQPDRTVHFGVT